MRRTAAIPTAQSAVALRAATPADLPTLARMWRSAWMDAHQGQVPAELMAARGPEHFTAYAREHAASITVAADARARLLGLVIIGAVDGEIVQLAVDGGARGRGVGAALLASAEEQLSAQHREGWLAVVPGNTRARRFYERHGWQDAGPTTHLAPASNRTIPVPVHRYVKTLSSHRFRS